MRDQETHVRQQEDEVQAEMSGTWAFAQALSWDHAEQVDGP